MNKKEGERIKKFYFGGRETEGQLTPKLSLCVLKEQKWKGPREVTVVGGDSGIPYTSATWCIWG